MKYTIEPDFRDLFEPLNEQEMENARAANEADPEHKRIPPIVLWKVDSKTKIVVDGHHTLKIRENMRVNGKPPKIKTVEMDFPDRQHAKVYAYSAQFARRNLTDSQRAMKAAEYAELLQICSELSPCAATTSKSAAIAEAASTAGASERSTWSADKIKEHGSKAIVEAVQQGEVSVSDAESIVDLPKTDQAAALKRVRAGKAKTLKAAAAMEDPEPPKPPEPPKDKTGRAIPNAIQSAFELGDKVRSTSRKIAALVKEIVDLSSSDEGLTHRSGAERLAVSAIQVARKDLKAAIEAGLPHAVCPYCKGRGCKECDKLGWIHKDRWNGIPEERRTA